MAECLRQIVPYWLAGRKTPSYLLTCDGFRPDITVLVDWA